MPIRVNPPRYVLPAWNEPPVSCQECGGELRGCYFDHPDGYFCSMECAGMPVDRPVTYREAVKNDPLLALRDALGEIR